MKEIICFTRPDITKQMYVEVTHDYEKDIFILDGIDVFGRKIKQKDCRYNTIMHAFYRELCWMLNEDIMTVTAIQRTMPKTASRKYKPLKKTK